MRVGSFSQIRKIFSINTFTAGDEVGVDTGVGACVDFDNFVGVGVDA